MPTTKDGAKAPACLTLAIQNASSGWHCAGQLASAGSKFQCECDLPLLDDPVLNSKSGATVETTWRGFSIAPTGKWPAIAGELSFDFSNVGTQGKASISAGNVTVTGNATMFRTNGPNSKLCPTNELLFEHEGGGNLSCSYAMNYQAGGASSYMAIGCNINSSMPTLVDHKNYDMASTNMVLWKCSDPWHCDFKAPTPTPDPALEQKKQRLRTFVEQVLRQPARRGRSLLNADPCSSYTSCDTCTKAGLGCQFCYGDLFINGTLKDNNKNHCFSGNTTDNVKCGPNRDGTEAVTLKENCTVYKCAWAHYRPPSVPDPAFKPNCTALNHSCGTPTTADDPCFYPTGDYEGKALCAMFTEQNKCKSGCIDPTKGCNRTTGQCSYNNKCDPYATCECTNATLYQGLQINNGYAPGIWTINLTISNVTNNLVTSLKLIHPGGLKSESYNVVNWVQGNKSEPDHGDLEIAGVPGVQGQALFNRYGEGTFGQNFYFGFLKGGGVKPDWANLMYTPGGQEFAFFACQHCIPHGTVYGGKCAANLNTSGVAPVSDRGNVLNGGCMIPMNTTAWLA